MKRTVDCELCCRDLLRNNNPRTKRNKKKENLAKKTEKINCVETIIMREKKQSESKRRSCGWCVLYMYVCVFVWEAAVRAGCRMLRLMWGRNNIFLSTQFKNLQTILQICQSSKSTSRILSFRAYTSDDFDKWNDILKFHGLFAFQHRIIYRFSCFIHKLFNEFTSPLNIFNCFSFNREIHTRTTRTFRNADHLFVPDETEYSQ